MYKQNFPKFDDFRIFPVVFFYLPWNLHIVFVQCKLLCIATKFFNTYNGKKSIIYFLNINLVYAFNNKHNITIMSC